VMISSENVWALMHEHRSGVEPNAEALIAEMAPVDLILIEGFKDDTHPKLEIHRAGNAKPLLYLNDPNIVAIATNKPLETNLPQLDIDNILLIADFIETHCALERQAVPGIA